MSPPSWLRTVKTNITLLSEANGRLSLLLQTSQLSSSEENFRISQLFFLFPCRKMVAKSLIAGLVVLLMAAVSLFLGVFMGLGSKNLPSSSDHFFSKAAVAADAGACSEVGR